MTVDNRGTDNGSIRVESGKNIHRKEATHNGNNVRQNYLLRSFIVISIQIHIFLLAFPHTELGAPVRTT